MATKDVSVVLTHGAWADVTAEHPIWQYVLVIERLVFGFSAANKAAVAQTDVVYEPLGAEKEDSSSLIHDRAIIRHGPHVDRLKRDVVVSTNGIRNSTGG
jgi:hypothetical protein